MTKTRYPSLNGLRALSIVLVIAHHMNIKSGLMGPLWGIPGMEPFVYLLQDGHLGVSVFFVISGFLITSLMLNEEAATKTVSLKKFYIRRTIRIFPAYYFMLFVYAILQSLHLIYISHGSWLTAITYTKYFNWDRDWYTAHAWSLSIEEQFYLCWPLIFLAGKKVRKIGAIAMVVLVPFVRVYFYLHPSQWITELSFFTRVDAIATGCLIALYKDRILQAVRPCFTLLFYVSIAGLLAFPYLDLWTKKEHFEFILVPIGTTHGTLGNVFTGIIILYSVFGPQRLWFKFLNLRVINYIGLLSYSIYLWQQFFVSNNGMWATRLPQSFAFIIIAALCSYYFIEKPFSKLRTRFEVPE